MKKRIIALMLFLLLVFSAPFSAAAAEHATRSGGSWEAIEAIEACAIPANAAQSESALAVAFTGRVDEMIAAVQRAADYVPGSLDRHGDFFFWETQDGRANGYSPSFRARTRAIQAGQPAKTDALPAPSLLTDSENAPDTRNVAVFIPYSGSYYFQSETCIALGQQLADSTDGSLAVYTAENATIDTVAEAIENAGILLFNSHGQTDYELGYDYCSRANTSYLCIPTDVGITAADQKPVSGPYGTYRHAYYAGKNGDEEYYCVDGTCIRNHMHRDAPHSMIWMGFCLGMATDGLFGPLQEKGVEAMVGFSHAVTVNADHDYRAVFCRALLQGRTVGEAAEMMKEEIGCPDPYQHAHDPAYPIAVSSQDPYPGRDHLSDGQTVCSTWELYPAYPITVKVEPAGSAVTELRRTELTVTPNDGYLFSDWEITAGDATAEQDGNVLRFRLHSPCSVTVRMGARTPASLAFHTGPGQFCPTINAYENDTVLLPAPDGVLEADAYTYHFLGWSKVLLTEDTAERPLLLAPGKKMQLSAGTAELYAVYGYFAGTNPEEKGQFRLVSEAPEDWAGDYVITYQSIKILRASSMITGQQILSPFAVATDSTAGFFVDGDWLNEVPDDLIYSFVPSSEGAYLLKMKTSENYLSVPSASAMLSTVSDPDAAEAGWKLSWSDGTVKITNRRYSSRILQYSTGSSGFCTLTSLRLPLTLYRSVPGTHFYTTQPGFAQDEPDPVPDPPSLFDDVTDPSAYYFDPVYWAVAQGITGGTGNNRFSPGMACTRAQVVTFLYNAFGRPDVESPSASFSDVPESAYFFHPVYWAVNCKITGGTGGNCFRPNDPCTRSQIVTFLWAAAGRPEPQTAENPFSDVKQSSYFRKPVLWAVENGITGGVGGGKFGAFQTCTRGQAVTFLFKAVQAASQ